eukprot:903843-Karenia_brevis.AAC.1
MDGQKCDSAMQALEELQEEHRLEHMVLPRFDAPASSAMHPPQQDHHTQHAQPHVALPTPQVHHTNVPPTPFGLQSAPTLPIPNVSNKRPCTDEQQHGGPGAPRPSEGMAASVEDMFESLHRRMSAAMDKRAAESHVQLSQLIKVQMEAEGHKT